ncbi:hypothetical protein A3C91_02205 [Candidatus Azambacteria bacterium RIFCSPHIGHO2_02_FULL_52_12]|uniref:Uncharacterized protein n=1 Tax=Candidatus Azambacteria bacterium RIFCSPLOWO2_01_FULL_46_25 TaxID=1797298 RepID=A0A1F5BVK2_9BACT|nr:MAG: hypothetical protein A3C91_02205 [Candidatus Azambacteria bacterium RIFCSPHIGHO2_02_FULL_52_12]OGD34637.1 MAG: hypothetical protein A2988_04005 [Candidatus Azambacteria bacterium RIFCSPLOWO2_01_FULL_46_25]OGD37104.1 MAG: hypothetical protein A2850_04865 [Candidatus Azambacteria bacterium RIFCSPHIGHO2_01_FULL_51_74]
MVNEQKDSQEYLCSRCNETHFSKAGSANEVCPVYGTDTLTATKPIPPISQSIDDWKKANPGRPL